MFRPKLIGIVYWYHLLEVVSIHLFIVFASFFYLFQKYPSSLSLACFATRTRTHKHKLLLPKKENERRIIVYKTPMKLTWSWMNCTRSRILWLKLYTSLNSNQCDCELQSNFILIWRRRKKQPISAHSLFISLSHTHTHTLVGSLVHVIVWGEQIFFFYYIQL